MYEWNVTKSLDHLNGLQWENLLKFEHSLTHPERIYSYCLAREALRLCLLKYGHSPLAEELKVEHYSSVIAFPTYTLSLSHTKKSGAALLAPRSEFRSVGVDVEENNRVVKEEIIKKISHPEDEELRNLELWCLKEAAFKCLMNSQKFQDPIPFSEIQVSAKKWKHSPSGSEGELLLKLLPLETVAMAFWKS